MGHHPRIRVVAAAAALAVALGAVAACGGGKSAGKRAAPPQCKPTGVVSPGEPIPTSCEFETLDGKTLKLGDLLGTPSVINFWASWCTYCIAEMPTFQKVATSFGDRLRIVGADLLGVQGETRGLAETFAKSTGVTYELIIDEGGFLYAHFSARLVMPVTIFVRANGVVAQRQFGPLDEPRLRAILKDSLGLE